MGRKLTQMSRIMLPPTASAAEREIPAIAAAKPIQSTAPDSPWARILSAAELGDYHARTAALHGPIWANYVRAFYESRSPSELRDLAKQAWNCSDLEAFQMAQSYLAAREVV